MNQHWSPESPYTHLNAYDPALGIPWPIAADDAIRSPKDVAHPPLAAVTPMVV